MEVYMVYNYVDTKKMEYFSPIFFDTLEEVEDYLRDEYNIGEEIEECRVIKINLDLGLEVNVDLSISLKPPF